ncbi:Mobile element protein [Labilithrix luteola]|uniref:Mobile element protein n=1 Tax=Labilithrix luteola TaxID=1391654 RepID=A0A0K1Q7F4_9BACT|nr:IS3 family transposase [Labilithrix luteola]AKV01325.1 Mobile element protein [Labilithrix luteola]
MPLRCASDDPPLPWTPRNARRYARSVRWRSNRYDELGGRLLQKRRFRRTTDSSHDSPIAPNIVARDFAPATANEVWAGDVTYIATGEGWGYLAILLDLHSRRVVGWALSATNDTQLALAALRRAVASRHCIPAGLVHHTDRGSPYASADYRAALDAYGMTASMSRRGDCWDNAVSESFFATLRAELVDHENYATRRAAEKAIGDYIDRFYNVERLHSFLDYVSPIEFELRLTSPRLRHSQLCPPRRGRISRGGRVR